MAALATPRRLPPLSSAAWRRGRRQSLRPAPSPKAASWPASQKPQSLMNLTRPKKSRARLASGKLAAPSPSARRRRRRPASPLFSPAPLPARPLQRRGAAAACGSSAEVARLALAGRPSLAGSEEPRARGPGAGPRRAQGAKVKKKGCSLEAWSAESPTGSRSKGQKEALLLERAEAPARASARAGCGSRCDCQLASASAATSSWAKAHSLALAAQERPGRFAGRAGGQGRRPRCWGRLVAIAGPPPGQKTIKMPFKVPRFFKRVLSENKRLQLSANAA